MAPNQLEVTQRVVGPQFGVARQPLTLRAKDLIALRAVNLAQQAVRLGVVGLSFDGFL